MPSSLVATGVQFPDNSIQTTAATSEFTSGTVMLFAQTAAPTGWTKNTSTGNNTALRLVTGTAGTGGSVAFTTAFASQTPSGTVSVSGSAGNTTLTTPQIPSHSHTANYAPQYGGALRFGRTNNNSITGTLTTNNTGGGGSHSHPLTISSSTFSGNAINLAVSYVDVIRATKN
jgi:4-aminobutyrate aminotransferase-like enzyme